MSNEKENANALGCANVCITIGSRDVMEQALYDAHPDILKCLLKDYSYKNITKSGKYYYNNIRWNTSSYESLCSRIKSDSCISVESITGKNKNIIKPRVVKTIDEQKQRSQDSAEVFTPIWVCNLQNNLIDKAWFNSEISPFSEDLEKAYKVITNPIKFPEGKTWQDYVLLQRLEITCGEAPYLASRYDVVTGEMIPVRERIGLLDRKLRVITENVLEKDQWLKWAYKAVQNIYGFDYQGDNVLLARENILFTVLEWYREAFPTSTPTIVDDISLNILKDFINKISWNIWQMDGITYTVPNKLQKIEETDLFGNVAIKHVPIYSEIMDWSTSEKLYFKDLIKKGF